MPTLQTRPFDWFMSDPNQPRKSFDLEEIDRLGDDMVKRGVLVPLIAREKGSRGITTDGGRRLLAAARKGIKELPVMVYEEPQTDSEIRGIQLATEIHRSGLGDHERYLAYSELMTMNPDWRLADLAKFLNVNPSAITKWMSPSKCTGEWQEAFAAGLVGITDCYYASRESEAQQAVMLAMKLAGAKRDDLVEAGRKHRDANKPTVKLTRVKCVLPSSGVSITASGAELSLDEFIESLSEAQKEAKKTRDNGGDIKSFQSLMAAKNKQRNE